MTTCEFFFDQNEHGTYFTGQIVTGRIVIGLNKKKKLRGIQLKISGYSSANWRDRRSGQRKEYHHKRRRFTAREDYIASSTFLIGSENGNDITIDAGTHTFTFQCLIPENCPSSFEGTYGHIRYVAKVSLLNSVFKNHTHSVGFTVLKLLDLNQESNILKMPANIEAMQGFCLSTAKPVLLTVDITQTGYVPGQMILVSGDVNNQSNSDAKKVYVFLNLKATYISDSPRINSKTERICLVKKKSSPVARRTRRNFTEIIRVPATAPTCESFSKVIRVTYEIAVVAVMNGFVGNPKAVIPITIGNVPLQTAPMIQLPRTIDVPSTSANASLSVAQNIGSIFMDSAVPEPEKDHPPPTYEEAMFMTADIGDDEVQSPNGTHEAVRFTPRYPVFDVDGMLIPESAANPNQQAPATTDDLLESCKWNTYLSRLFLYNGLCLRDGNMRNLENLSSDGIAEEIIENGCPLDEL